MRSSTTDILSDKRAAQITRIIAWSWGGAQMDLFTEQDSNLSFDTLKNNANNLADSINNENEDEILLRTRATYAQAIIRDVRYMMAGRNHLFSLGANNSIRELYEGGKISIDAGE